MPITNSVVTLEEMLNAPVSTTTEPPPLVIATAHWAMIASNADSVTPVAAAAATTTTTGHVRPPAAFTNPAGRDAPGTGQLRHVAFLVAGTTSDPNRSTARSMTSSSKIDQ